MLALVLMLSLANPHQPALATPTLAQREAVLLAATKEGLEALNQFDRDVDTQLDSGANRPLTGLILYSSPELGSDTLQALLVVTVLANEPADRAGIKPDDRIVAIGSQRIEHESAEEAYGLLHNGPGPITVTVSREGHELTVVIQREPLACGKRALQSIDRARWTQYSQELREKTSTIRQELPRNSGDELMMRILATQLQGLSYAFQGVVDAFDKEIPEAVGRECLIK